MKEILIEFLSKCKNNSELEDFFEGLLECWMHGYNAMYWHIEDNSNIEIIKKFFEKLYQKHENFYSIKEWFVPTNDRNEYEIKWYFNLEDMPKN